MDFLFGDDDGAAFFLATASVVVAVVCFVGLCFFFPSSPWFGVADALNFWFGDVDAAFLSGGVVAFRFLFGVAVVTGDDDVCGEGRTGGGGTFGATDTDDE